MASPELDESADGGRPDEDFLTTRDVARMLGVGEATVKRWADAALLVCFRTPGGHRKFRDRDVRAFIRSRGFSAPSTVPVDISPSAVLRLARVADSAGLDRLSNAALDGGMVVEGLCDEILVPALAQIGDLWACNEATIAEEHVVSTNMVELLARLRSRVDHVPLSGNVAVIACASGEWHDIACRMLSLVLRSRGFTTFVTGANAPVLDVVKLVDSHRASLVALSASAVGAGAQGAREAAETLRRALRPERVRIFAGGSAFGMRAPPEGVEYAPDLRTFARLLDGLSARGPQAR